MTATPVFIQSFETGNLRMLPGQTKVRLVQLMEVDGQRCLTADRGHMPSYADLATPAGLAEVATYAEAIGPNEVMVMPRDGNGRYHGYEDKDRRDRVLVETTGSWYWVHDHVRKRASR